jgi:DnaK suppressor protein
MAAKKPPAKATKAKKTVAKKAEPVKKAAPAKKPVPVRSKPAAERPAPKPASKPAPAPVAKAPSPPPKPAKAAASVAPAAPPPTKASPVVTKAVEPKKAEAKPVEPRRAEPKQLMPARPAVMRYVEPVDNSAAGNDADDGENPDSGLNLLAGPRNVKPYIARRGELYMGKEQLEHFRQILNSWKKDLMHEVDRTVLHMKDEAANFPDPNDRATQESEFSLELRTRDRERKLIRKIEEAIKRIDDGSYGYCNETGEEIGIKRLEARPVATLSLEAQERRERREKQYGDRDDRYR